VVAGAGVPIAPSTGTAPCRRLPAAQTCSSARVPHRPGAHGTGAAASTSVGVGFCFRARRCMRRCHAGGTRREIGESAPSSTSLDAHLIPRCCERGSWLRVCTTAVWLHDDGEVAGRLGAERVDGRARASRHGRGLRLGPTQVAEYWSGQVRTFAVQSGGSAASLAVGVRDRRRRRRAERRDHPGAARGRPRSPRDVVLMNAPAALMVAARSRHGRGGRAGARVDRLRDALTRSRPSPRSRLRLGEEADARRASEAGRMSGKSDLPSHAWSRRVGGDRG